MFSAPLSPIDTPNVSSKAIIISTCSINGELYLNQKLGVYIMIHSNMIKTEKELTVSRESAPRSANLVAGATVLSSIDNWLAIVAWTIFKVSGWACA